MSLGCKCLVIPNFVNEWVRGAFRLQNITLKTLLEKVMAIVANIDEISFSHVKRQFNSVADDLSKQVVLGQQVTMQVEEHREGEGKGEDLPPMT